MNLKTLIIHQNKTLYNILEEISDNINFKIEYKDNIDLNFNGNQDYIVITKNKILNIKKKLVINTLPIKLNKLIEIVNITFLKQEYNAQSNITIGNYDLNLNSRTLSLHGITLDLTEMEANLILFLNNSKEPSSVKRLQKNVWKQMPDLETHTVETHIYRLRKKIKHKFKDDSFIKSLKDGYQIK
tara:strand:+ start:2271 stop:2825 length:555 start_codon:yes stop_codon:yes gene_type:complete